MVERSITAGCKPVARLGYGGSNPSGSTMKDYTIKRLWQGLASVRDYVVKDCIVKKQGLRLTLIKTGEVMEIPYENLEKLMFQAHKTEMVSKFDGKKYLLVDFIWKPTLKQTQLL